MPDRNDHKGVGEGRKDHLFMFGELTPERAQEIAERLLSGWDHEFTLFINSDGGSSFDALALVNLLKMHGRVDTVCLGVALSGAADLLAAGRKRLVVPSAVAMIHQVSWDMGTEFTANLVKNARFLERLNDVMAEMLARDTRRAKEQLMADMVTDHYLFGQEIIDYGLADSFYEPPAPRRQPRHRGRRVPETFERLARVQPVE
jgi:ATP-dependent Clp endopeptidase proteolytic subunit ClpP